MASSKRKSSSSAHNSAEDVLEARSVVEDEAELERNWVLLRRLLGSKAAKLVHRNEKEKEHQGHAQAEATSELAVAQMRKVACLKDQNLLFLITAPGSESNPIAQQYLRMRQEMELKIFEKHMQAEEAREVQERRDKEASEVALAATLEVERVQMKLVGLKSSGS
jgi:hypothetical protein